MLNFNETMIMKDPEIKRIVALKVEKKILIQTSGKEKKGYTIVPLITLSGKLLITLLAGLAVVNLENPTEVGF